MIYGIIFIIIIIGIIFFIIKKEVDIDIYIEK